MQKHLFRIFIFSNFCKFFCELFFEIISFSIRSPWAQDLYVGKGETSKSDIWIRFIHQPHSQINGWGWYLRRERKRKREGREGAMNLGFEVMVWSLPGTTYHVLHLPFFIITPFCFFYCSIMNITDSPIQLLNQRFTSITVPLTKQHTHNTHRE